MKNRSMILSFTVLSLLGMSLNAQPRGNRTRSGSADAAVVGDAGTPAGDAVARYDALLRAVVRSSGVNYVALHGRLPELLAFHEWLAAHGPTTTPAEFTSASARKTYWLNAYNAIVLRGVAEAPASMNNVIAYLPNNGFFRGRRWRVDGRELSLDEIENRQVREVFHDARVHFALNCAARSCPPLRASAYRPDRVDAQLDEQAQRYFAGAGRVTVNAATHTVRVVQLFEWFRDDFAAPIPGRPAATVRGPLGFVLRYAPAVLRTEIEAACGSDGAQCTMTYEPYDWLLNSAR
jgi:hypothetical protein